MQVIRPTNSTAAYLICKIRPYTWGEYQHPERNIAIKMLAKYVKEEINKTDLFVTFIVYEEDFCLLGVGYTVPECIKQHQFYYVSRPVRPTVSCIEIAECIISNCFEKMPVFYGYRH